MSARLCICATCERRFVVVAPVNDANCGCGGALDTIELEAGVYELKRARPAPRRRSPRKSKNGASPNAEIPVEPDLGYGESHGYGPAHGGPTGPGDAPAPEIAPDEPAPRIATDG